MQRGATVASIASPGVDVPACAYMPRTPSMGCDVLAIVDSDCDVTEGLALSLHVTS